MFNDIFHSDTGCVRPCGTYQSFCFILIRAEGTFASSREKCPTFIDGSENPTPSPTTDKTRTNLQQRFADLTFETCEPRPLTGATMTSRSRRRKWRKVTLTRQGEYFDRLSRGCPNPTRTAWGSSGRDHLYSSTREALLSGTNRLNMKDAARKCS